MWSRNLCQINSNQTPIAAPRPLWHHGGAFGSTNSLKKMFMGLNPDIFSLNAARVRWPEALYKPAWFSTSPAAGSPGAIVLPVWSLLNWHLESPLQSPTACTSWDSKSRSSSPQSAGPSCTTFPVSQSSWLTAAQLLPCCAVGLQCAQQLLPIFLLH